MQLLFPHKDGQLRIHRSLKVFRVRLQFQSRLLKEGWIHFKQKVALFYVTYVIRFKTGDAQAHTPQPKNCAVIIPKDLWSLTAPECYSLLSPRPAAFLIAAKSPPGKYAIFPAFSFLYSSPSS